MDENRKEKGKKRSKLRPLLQLALIIGISVHLFGFLAFRVIPPEKMEVHFPLPFTHYTGSEEDNDDIPLYDQGILFDSEPLFLPTIWNYASLLKPLSLQEESSPLFEPFSPLITLKDSFLQQETAKNSLVENLTPIEVLKQDKWNYFSSFGEKAFTLISLSKRLGFLEVVDMHTGATVYQEEITEHIEGLIEQPLWEPVSFSLIITPIGVKGIPFLLQGSGADTVNQAIKAHLLRPFYLAHLPRGYYKATIGP